MRFLDFTAIKVQVVVFWVVMPCSELGVIQMTVKTKKGKSLDLSIG